MPRLKFAIPLPSQNLKTTLGTKNSSPSTETSLLRSLQYEVKMETGQNELGYSGDVG